MEAKFEVLGPIAQIELIAQSAGIRQLEELNAQYGQGHWRKLKGVARVRTEDGFVCQAELHWYEAHGIGKRRMKIKRFLG
ncbi:MAG TPA: hypothetical protein VKX17_05735 [Planctomycetota bacterium]|nr:hypothetical protein [Planctomycetota bacterium]